MVAFDRELPLVVCVLSPSRLLAHALRIKLELLALDLHALVDGHGALPRIPAELSALAVGHFGGNEFWREIAWGASRLGARAASTYQGEPYPRRHSGDHHR